MTRVLITGASGFIGSALAARLRGTPGFDVRTAHRSECENASTYAVGALGPDTNWRPALEGVDMVVHLAGPAHARFTPAGLRTAIVDGTEALARQAAEAGVRRIVFVSSIKACVERTDEGQAASESTPPRPADAYGAAKLEAERRVLSYTQLRPVVLRPPLVHAPNAKANWARLLRVLDTPSPLPLGGMENRRNVIALDSLTSAIIAVLRAGDGAPSGVFHLADQPSVSTTEIATLVRQGMGRTARLFRAPWLLPRQLTENLEIDSAAFASAFGYAGADAREALVACGKAWSAGR